MAFKSGDNHLQFCKSYQVKGSPSSAARQGWRLEWENGFFVEHGFYLASYNNNTPSSGVVVTDDDGNPTTLSFNFGTNPMSELYGLIVTPMNAGNNPDLIPYNAMCTGYSNTAHTNHFGHNAEAEIVHTKHGSRSACELVPGYMSYMAWGKR
jgi:hypothetical protein